MGRIKTRWVKNISGELVKKYPDKFSNNFESNKKFLQELNLIEDKSVRNKIAGSIIRIIRKKEVLNY